MSEPASRPSCQKHRASHSTEIPRCPLVTCSPLPLIASKLFKYIPGLICKSHMSLGQVRIGYLIPKRLPSCLLELVGSGYQKVLAKNITGTIVRCTTCAHKLRAKRTVTCKICQHLCEWRNTPTIHHRVPPQRSGYTCVPYSSSHRSYCCRSNSPSPQRSSILSCAEPATKQALV